MRRIANPTQPRIKNPYFSLRRIANPTQPNPLFCGLKILILFCVGLQIRRNRGLQIRRNRIDCNMLNTGHYVTI